MKYIITPDKDDINIYHLYSVVPTNFGGDAENWITSGTLEHIHGVMKMLEGIL
jgi:hypothetical protein